MDDDAARKQRAGMREQQRLKQKREQEKKDRLREQQEVQRVAKIAESIDTNIDQPQQLVADLMKGLGEEQSRWKSLIERAIRKTKHISARLADGTDAMSIFLPTPETFENSINHAFD
eukprot:Colp12_sorted_trinity150504_noHs@10919